MTDENQPILPAEVPVFTFELTGDTTALFAAMAAAQGAYKAAKKSATNPHFKSKFAPLEEVIEATAEGNKANGIAVLQPMVSDQFGGLFLMTIVSHSLGGCLKATVPLGAVDSIQDLGSKVTYMRRYARSALLGIVADEDDDGNAAQAQTSRREPSAPRPQASAIPNPLADSVMAQAKANNLDGKAFAKLVYEQTGNAWKDCDETDARKLLGVLKGGA